MNADAVLYLVLLSLIPGFEGRYAVAAGVAMGMSPGEALAAASLGSAALALGLPRVYPILDGLLTTACRREGKHERLLCRMYVGYVLRARARARDLVERYGAAGLALFVAIPLPVTGVWTGSVAAYVLGVPRTKATLSLLLGGVASNALVAAAVHPLWGT